jgi:cytochrome oxidase Cu insertion factor (SCO1/SenC/PrrC family)
MRRSPRVSSALALRLTAIGVAAVLVLLPHAAAAHRGDHVFAVRPVMDFVPPAAGSYRLNVIQAAPDGRVLAADGRAHRLAEFTRGRITLLSLIYTYCTDPAGCALAYETCVDLRGRVLADPALHDRVRFVSLSFDPLHDTPATMRTYGGRYGRADGPLPWHFLTSRNVRDLQPILEGFGQDIEVAVDDRGRPTHTISHMLKVFLIDADGQVREIYSTAFLHPEAMLNDLRTLAIEADARSRQ